jgi:hypothetical protein
MQVKFWSHLLGVKSAPYGPANTVILPILSCNYHNQKQPQNHTKQNETIRAGHTNGNKNTYYGTLTFRNRASYI